MLCGRSSISVNLSTTSKLTLSGYLKERREVAKPLIEAQRKLLQGDGTPGRTMASTTTFETMPQSGLSASEHSRQLRKAVIASTIGTTIEWYDFFMYGTAAGLIFGKLLLSKRRCTDGHPRGFRHLFHWFRQSPHRGRDIRPLWRPHWPERHLDRHAAVHGYRDLPDRLCADLRLDRHMGCGHLDPDAHGPGHRRRWGVGRFSSLGDGMVAPSWTAWVGRLVAAIWRPGWSVPREPIDLGLQRLVGRSVRHLGVASSFRALDHTDWGWPVDSSRYS